ncbi:tetratricopeptide repeat protein [Aquimarina sp. SS2-1]|uniref:tetratricopeptide repeat-containing sensor histidine kinase n=1 Tax=Aquimarina besae TaxID=3342247 RepID=UPI00367084EF
MAELIPLTMPKLLHNIVLYFLFMLCMTVTSQVKDNNIPPSFEEDSLFYKEKATIIKAYEVFNSDQNHKIPKIAHHLLKTVKTEYAKANANLLLAYFYKNKTLIDSSNYYVEESLKYNTTDNDSINIRGKIAAYNILGINYLSQGLYEEGKKWHQKGITLTEKYNEEDFYYTHLHGLARTYTELKNYEEALRLYKECLSYKEDPEIVYGSYINIGDIYTKLGDYENSNKYLKKAEKLALTEDTSIALSIIALNLAENSKKTRQYNSAINYYQKSIEISDKKDFKQVSLEANINLAEVFVILKRYNEAETILQKSLLKAKELKLATKQIHIYQALSEIAVRKNNYKRALEYNVLHNKMEDSINQLQKNKEISEIEVKYQTSQKEKEIKLLLAENSNRNLELELEREKAIREKGFKNIILYSFLALLIPIIGLLVTYYQKIRAQSELNQKQKEISEQKIASLLKDQELKVIKASVEGQDKERKRIAQELHDSIGGNLAAIKLQLNNAPNKNEGILKKINPQIDNTYELVRNLSHNLIPKKFGKNGFCDVLEEYFNNIGSASNLNTSFSAYPREEIDSSQEKVKDESFKIIQELITNSIKHSEATSVELQINLVENTLNIMFEDNGKGFDTDKNKDGIGFRNIKSRLQNVSGSLYIDSRIHRGTIIDISIPVDTKRNRDKILISEG